MEYFKKKNIPEPFWITDTKEDDARVPRFLQRKKEIGVDPREAWGVDYAFVVWLFNILSLLLDEGGQIIDFEFHDYTIAGKTKNQEQWMQHMLTLSEKYLRVADTIDGERENYYRLNAIVKIFSKVIHQMWW